MTTSPVRQGTELSSSRLALGPRSTTKPHTMHIPPTCQESGVSISFKTLERHTGTSIQEGRAPTRYKYPLDLFSKSYTILEEDPNSLSLRGLQCEGHPGKDLIVARFHLNPDGCLEVANCVAHARNPKDCRFSRSYSNGDEFKLMIRQRLPSDQDEGTPLPAYACHLTPPFILDSDKTLLEAEDRAIRSFSPLDPPTPHPVRPIIDLSQEDQERTDHSTRPR